MTLSLGVSDFASSSDFLAVASDVASPDDSAVSVVSFLISAVSDVASFSPPSFSLALST